MFLVKCQIGKYKSQAKFHIHYDYCYPNNMGRIESPKAFWTHKRFCLGERARRSFSCWSHLSSQMGGRGWADEATESRARKVQLSHVISQSDMQGEGQPPHPQWQWYKCLVPSNHDLSDSNSPSPTSDWQVPITSSPLGTCQMGYLSMSHDPGLWVQQTLTSFHHTSVTYPHRDR